MKSCIRGVFFRFLEYHYLIRILIAEQFSFYFQFKASMCPEAKTHSKLYEKLSMDEKRGRWWGL